MARTVIVPCSPTQVSLALLEVFGMGTEPAHWLLSFLLDKVVFNLTVWDSEEKLAFTSAALLTKLARSKHRLA